MSTQSTPQGAFKRARTPEQVQERRDAILAVARELLARRRAADVSLRELSDEVGLSMSNVLRYFDSREAIFAQILHAEWQDWLSELETALPAATRGLLRSGPARPRRVAAVLAGTLLARPLLCELMSGIATILERNIPVEFAREFKRQTYANRRRLADLVRAEFPAFSEGDSWDFSVTVQFTLTGLWPFTRPTDAIATVMRELGQSLAPESFRQTLQDIFLRQILGVLSLAEARS
ncbi:TetR family transcriptional regulator [Streptomyces sp. NPDC054770]